MQDLNRVKETGVEGHPTVCNCRICARLRQMRKAHPEYRWQFTRVESEDLDPGEVVSFYNEGLAFAKQERYREAVYPLLDAITYDPRYVNAYNLLGKVYMHLGKSAKARGCWEDALRIDPLDLVAMKCLEASTPKPFMERAQSFFLILGFILVLGTMSGGGYWLYQQFDQIQPAGNGNQSPLLVEKDERIKDLNSQIQFLRDRVIALLQSKVGILNVSQGVANITPSHPTPLNQAILPGGQTIRTAAPREETSGESPKMTIPKTVDELLSQYNYASKQLALKGKYTAALPVMESITASQLTHRYVIGNAYFWLGICHRKLGHPDQALAAFQAVTARNSYKAEDAKMYIVLLQEEMQSQAALRH